MLTSVFILGIVDALPQSPHDRAAWRRSFSNAISQVFVCPFFYPNGGAGLLRQVFDLYPISDITFFESRICYQRFLRSSVGSRVTDIVIVGGRYAVRIRLGVFFDTGYSRFCFDTVLFCVQIFVSDIKSDCNDKDNNDNCKWTYNDPPFFYLFYLRKFISFQ